MSPARAEPDSSTYTGRLGHKIREQRESRGLSMREVVEKMETNGFRITIATLAHWEVGRRGIDVNALPAIAGSLGTTIHQLLPKN